MSLLTHDWRAPDPTGAVNAYLSGIRVGAQETQVRLEQQALAQRALEASTKAAQVKQHADIDMAMQLLQESRLNRAAQIQEQFQAERLKTAGKVADARVAAYNRANQPPEPFTPLPLPDGGEAPARPSEAGGAGDVLNWEANAGQPDAALSLAQASPFRREADFMGETPQSRAFTEAGDFEEAAGAIPRTMAEGSLLQSANAGGGDNPGAVQGADGLPSGGSIADSIPLMAGADARTPADQVLAPAAVKRINLAGSTGGKKAAEAQMKVELGVEARAKAVASGSKPLTRNFPDGTFRQWNDADSTWDILAEKPAKTDKPIVRNFADGTTRQFNPETNTWDVEAAKPAKDTTAADAAKLRAEQDQLIQRANHQRSVVKDLESKVFKSDGKPIVVSWPFERDGKFFKPDEKKPKKFVEIKKEEHDAMLTANGRIQEAAAKLASEKSKLSSFETQIEGFDSGVASGASPTVTPATEDKVAVVAPDGRKGRIPRAQLAAALAAGYKAQ